MPKLPQAPITLTALSTIRPPLQLLWLMTSEGPVPYFLRVAALIMPEDRWVPLALTTIPVL